MVVWGVVSSEIEQMIEFFRTRREAERMLAEVVRDEPDWLEQFRIERIELSRESELTHRLRQQRFDTASNKRPALLPAIDLRVHPQ